MPVEYGPDSQDESTPEEDLHPWSREFLKEKRYELLQNRLSTENKVIYEDFAMPGRLLLDASTVNQIDDDPRSYRASWALRAYVGYKYRELVRVTTPDNGTHEASATWAADKPAV